MVFLEFLGAVVVIIIAMLGVGAVVTWWAKTAPVKPEAPKSPEKEKV